jgi:hypothetical protein
VPHRSPKRIAGHDVKAIVPHTQPAHRASELLTTVHFACQASGKNFDYEVRNDARTLKDLWSRQLMLTCPHCREIHAFLLRSAYVQTMIDEPRLPIERLRAGSPVFAGR